jgi:hypothetical protein
MFLRHPLDQEFAGNHPLDTLGLADYLEGIAAHSE